MTSSCPSHELQPDSWWRRAVIYQIYIKSFADSNGDGFGDLRGATERLDYICKLGVDAVWLCPFYVSPNKDGGYDVSDHRNVDPMYGSLADAEEFIRSAHARDIRVIIDLVPNHSSDQHPFFQAALSTPPASFEWSRYHCVRGRGTAGELPPNNWQSFFGGSAWSPVPPLTPPSNAPDTSAATGWWYLHLFDRSQPDFNWQHADVATEFEETMKFWLQRGVDGFRIDVAPGLVKAMDYRDNVGDLHPARLLPLLKPLLPFVGEALPDHNMSHFDQPDVHDIYRKWRRFLDE
jgi:alpha-glucosidase